MVTGFLCSMSSNLLKNGILKAVLVVALVLFYPVANAAQPLTVLRVGTPSAVSELLAHTMSFKLKWLGWITDDVGVRTCAEAVQWIRDNPNKPVMAVMWADDLALANKNPTHKSACGDLKITQRNYVMPILKSYYSVCGKSDKNMGEFLHKGGRIAVLSHPIKIDVFKTILNEMKIKYMLVGVDRNSVAVNKILNDEVDYILTSNEDIIRDFGGRCFLTTAPKHIAMTLTDLHSGERYSVDSYVTNNKYSDYGAMPIYVAFNVNVGKLRSDIKQIIDHSIDYHFLYSGNSYRTGVMRGDSVQKQFDDFNRFVNGFGKK